MELVVLLVALAFLDPMFAANMNLNQKASKDLTALIAKYEKEGDSFEKKLFLAAKDGQDQEILNLLKWKPGLTEHDIRDALHAAYASGHLQTGKLIAKTVFERDRKMGLYLIEIGGYLLGIGIDVIADYYPKELLTPIKG